MKLLFGFLVIAFILLAVSLGYRAVSSPASFNLGEGLIPLIITAGILVALMTLKANHSRETSKEYLENATDLLSKAYEILEATRDKDKRPIRSRINWLTAARFICTAKDIGNLLSVDSHKRIWKEQEEYWRGRLRDLINPEGEGFPKEYYAEKVEHIVIKYGKDDRPPLSERSLVVLYRFIQWPKNAEDPLGEDGSFTEVEIDHMCAFGPKGLGQLLKEVRNFDLKRYEASIK